MHIALAHILPIKYYAYVMIDYIRGENIFYFGYGANRNASMMKAIVGRVPDGFEAQVSGFDLCIQTWNEMSETVQKFLTPSWTKKFRSYVLRPSNDSSHVVHGHIWRLTRKERKLIDNWEMTNVWYNIFVLSVCENDKCAHVEIQVVYDTNIKKTVNGKRYRTFLNSPRKMLKVASQCRRNFLGI
jgi:hypothetical protein